MTMMMMRRESRLPAALALYKRRGTHTNTDVSRHIHVRMCTHWCTMNGHSPPSTAHLHTHIRSYTYAHTHTEKRRVPMLEHPCFPFVGARPVKREQKSVVVLGAAITER
jgi:hypothetical protein